MNGISFAGWERYNNMLLIIQSSLGCMLPCLGAHSDFPLSCPSELQLEHVIHIANWLMQNP